MSALPITADLVEDEAEFDFAARVDALRCESTGELRRIVDEARREQERWRLEELAATRVLDDRDALPRIADARIDSRTANAKVAAARALESRPRIAAAAHAGELSWEQLQPLLEVSTPETDAEWAQRGRNLAPVDLHRMVRQSARITGTEAAARREARFVRSWRDSAQGMAGGRWWLPDVDGVLVDKVLDHMAERMRPAKDMAWDSLAHRKADALLELCRSYADAQPTGRFRIEIVNLLDPNATAFGPEIEGIRLAPETVTGLLPNAKIRDCHRDDTGLARTVKASRKALPADVERHIRRRDLHCRRPGCSAPVDEIHHLEPVAEFGETTDVHKLVGVCRPDHRILAPHGPYRLVGDPEQPDGLRLVHRNDLPRNGPSP